MYLYIYKKTLEKHREFYQRIVAVNKITSRCRISIQSFTIRKIPQFLLFRIGQQFTLSAVWCDSITTQNVPTKEPG